MQSSFLFLSKNWILIYGFNDFFPALEEAQHYALGGGHRLLLTKISQVRTCCRLEPEKSNFKDVYNQKHVKNGIQISNYSLSACIRSHKIPTFEVYFTTLLQENEHFIPEESQLQHMQLPPPPQKKTKERVFFII